MLDSETLDSIYWFKDKIFQDLKSSYQERNNNKTRKNVRKTKAALRYRSTTILKKLVFKLFPEIR